jgi:Tfp pilus assembly protein PilX
VNALRRRPAWHARHDGERGSSLVIALAMISVIGVSLVGVLNLASTSFKVVTAIRDQRTSAYTADAAVQTAIGIMAPSATAGTTAAGTSCLTTPAAITYTPPNAQPAASVACTVVQPRDAGLAAKMPPYALWTGSDGASLTPTGTVNTAGPVASNGTISAGSLDAGPFTVQATGACTGNITTFAPADETCATGQPYADPGYPSQAIAALGAPNPAPTCSVANGVLQFAAGYYTDPAKLESPNYGTCAAKYQYFKPGVYYFDFGYDPLIVDKTWDVSPGTVIVGGVVKGWNPATAGSRPGAPGGGNSVACGTEKDAATLGVQFVFGGESTMRNGGAGSTAELCASPAPVGTTQQIAIYGQKTGATPAAQTLTRVPAVATPTPPSGWAGLAPVNKVKPIAPSTTAIDGQYASYVVPSKSTAPAAFGSMLFSGFTLAVPAGAVDVSYALRVAHSEQALVATDISALTATIGTCVVDVPVHSTVFDATPVVDEIPLTTAACKTAVAGAFSLTLKATAVLNRSILENLDGLELLVTYTPPAVRAQSCGLAVCTVLTLGGGSKTVVWGTVYAPLASVSADYTSNTAFEFRRGVFARAVTTAGTPPADTTANFCLGYGAPCIGPARVLRFVASIGGVVRARALVRYVDLPAIGGRSQVVSWNAVRG